MADLCFRAIFLGYFGAVYLRQMSVPCVTLVTVVSYGVTGNHYENMHIQIYRKFYHQKIKKKSEKKSDIFHISAQN